MDLILKKCNFKYNLQQYFSFLPKYKCVTWISVKTAEYILISRMQIITMKRCLDVKRKKIRHLKETILTQHPSKILSLLTSSGLTSHLATATYRCTLRPHNIAVGDGFQVQQSTFLTTPRGETGSKPPTREGRKTVLFTPMLNNSLRREKHSRKH